MPTGILAGQTVTTSNINDTDTGWVNVTTSAGFTVQDQPRVRLKAGIVYFVGGWSNAGMAINGTYSVGTIPAGYRPTITTAVIIYAGAATGATGGVMRLQSDGTIQVRTGATLGAYYIGSAAYPVD